MIEDQLNSRRPQFKLRNFLDSTQGRSGDGSPQWAPGTKPPCKEPRSGGLSPLEGGALLHNKNRICDVKCIPINVNFWLKICHNTLYRFNLLSSSAISACEQYVLATLKRDELVFWTPRFYSWTPNFSVSTPHFGWTPRLNYADSYCWVASRKVW